MAGEMKHLHLFPTELPKDQLLIVLNAVRRIDDGRSVRDRVEAAWWCAGYAASFVPDSHPVEGVAALSDGAFAEYLDQVTNGEVRGLIPWDKLVQKFFELLMAWLQNQ